MPSIKASKRVLELLKKKKSAGLTEDEERQYDFLAMELAEEKLESRVYQVAGLIIIAMIIVGWFWWESGSEERAEKREHREKTEALWADQLSAKYTCQQFVNRNLRSTSTAKFLDPEQNVESVGNRRYVIMGPVDTQNDSGATTRSRYTCEVGISGDQWKVVDFQVLE